MQTHRSDTRRCPTVALAGGLARAIQDCGNCLVRHEAGKARHHFDNVGVDGPSVFTPAIAPDAERGMVAAAPSYDQCERAVLVTNDDFLDQRTNDLLAYLHRGAWTVPGSIDVVTEIYQTFSLHRARLGLPMARQCVQFGFEIAYDPKAIVPAPFKLGGDDPVVWIDRIILTSGSRSLVASLLQGEFEVTALFRVLRAASLNGPKRRLDSQRLEPLTISAPIPRSIRKEPKEMQGAVP